MSESPVTPRRRRRFAPLLLVAGVAGAIVLSLSMTNTLSAFTATIVNSNNTAASGTVILQEVNTATGGSTCTSTDTTGTGNASNTISNNSYSCSTINKYGGSTTMVPSNAAGTTNVSTVNLTFKNTGTATASTFTLTPGACTVTANGTLNGTDTAGFCSHLIVTITVGGTVVVNKVAASTLASSSAITLTVPNGATAVPAIVSVYLDNASTNADQGLAASQPLTWTLGS